MTTFYETLGIDPSASPADVKAAYRRESAKHHPDRAGGSAERMAEVNRAYACLSDPMKRARYDQTGSDPDSGPGPHDIARAILSQLFSDLLASSRMDIVEAAREHLDEMKQQLAAKVDSNRRRINSLAKRRGHVRTKRDDVPNMVHQLIDMEMSACEREISQAREQEEVRAVCVTLLDDYEEVGLDPKRSRAGFAPMYEFDMDNFRRGF